MGKFHWEVIVHHKVEKTLKRLHGEVLERILKAFHSLEENPRPSGAKKMRGYKNLFRVRVGDWRIIYTINDEELIILILTVASRGKAYKKY